MHFWLTDASGRVATCVGDPEADYAITQDEETLLLDVGRIAAQASGERPNALLLAYLIGLARGRHPETSLMELTRSATPE